MDLSKDYTARLGQIMVDWANDKLARNDLETRWNTLPSGKVGPWMPVTNYTPEFLNRNVEFRRKPIRPDVLYFVPMPSFGCYVIRKNGVLYTVPIVADGEPEWEYFYGQGFVDMADHPNWTEVTDPVPGFIDAAAKALKKYEVNQQEEKHGSF